MSVNKLYNNNNDPIHAHSLHSSDDAKDEDSKAISRSRLSSSRDMRTGTEPLPPLPSKSTSCDRPSRPTTPSPRPRNASRSRSRSRCASPDGRGGKEEGKEEKQGIRGASSRPVSWASPEMAPKLFKRLNGLEAGTLRQTAANSTKGEKKGIWFVESFHVEAQGGGYYRHEPEQTTKSLPGRNDFVKFF